MAEQTNPDVLAALRRQAAAERWLEGQIEQAHTRMIVEELERRDREERRAAIADLLKAK